MARQSGKYWIPAPQKVPKLYMREPVIIEDQSITTAGKQTLVIDKKDIEYMDGKRILIVDDVISTGGSLHALETLAAKSTGTVVGCCAALAEGDAAKRTDIFFLEPLPLFLQLSNETKLGWFGLGFAGAELAAAILPPLVCVPAAAFLVCLALLWIKTPQRQRHPGTGCAVRSCVVSGVYPCMGAARQGTGRADRDLHGGGGDGRRCFLQRKPPARYAAAD